MKLAVDRDRRPGRFLVTGSQTFGLMAGISDSLAGRAAVFTLPPLSIAEVSTSASRAETDAFLWRSGYPELWQHPIKAPKLYFADTGLLCFLLGFRKPADLTTHALWGAVWETFVISEVRKRLLATGHPPPLWFWRTAHGDELDLLVETGPERFVAVECKTAEQVTPDTLKGVRRLAEEYGAKAVRAARVACRRDRGYWLESRADARAVTVAGRQGLLAELADL